MSGDIFTEKHGVSDHGDGVPWLRTSGSSLFHILAVQAAVYIAVDMLPVPGAQGITELMYAAVFGGGLAHSM